jgi:hypothetical protein
MFVPMCILYIANELSSTIFEPRSYCVLVGKAIVIREVGFFFLAAAGEYSNRNEASWAVWLETPNSLVVYEEARSSLS